LIKKVYLWLLFSILFIIASYESYGYFYNPSIYRLDPILGWTSKPSFSKHLVQKSKLGEKYPVHHETNALGLRTYGQDTKDAIKILVIGDSFTMEPYAGNNQMWYAAFADSLKSSGFSADKNIFISAGGGGGWGTLQELLLLKTVQKEVNPDIFILQFCSNDFINNHFEWEQGNITRSQKYRRPYLGFDGQVKYSDSLFSPLWRNSMLGQSKIFNQVDVLVQIIQTKIYNGYGPKYPKLIQEKFEKESLEITTNLLNEMRAQLNGIPAYMINCSREKNGPNKNWIDLAEKTGFIPLASASNGDVHWLEPLGSTTVPDTVHLNFRGNKIYGELVAVDFLKSYGIQPYLGR
jgi:hypothetical protein